MRNASGKAFRSSGENSQKSLRKCSAFLNITLFARQISKDEIIEYLRPRVAKWWLPDDVVFVEAIPKTSVGKFDKKVLRKEYEAHSATQG